MLDANAARSWSNSLLVSDAWITSPSVYDDCLVYVAPFTFLLLIDTLVETL